MDPTYTWGYMTLIIAGKFVNITADTYPGIPGSAGYARAAERKFANVARVLGVTAEGQELKYSIKHLAAVEDMSALMGKMVSMGKLAVSNVAAQG